MLKIQKEPNCIGKTFRLPKELAEKLERIACKNNMSQNRLVIQCLNYALHEINTEAEEKLTVIKQQIIGELSDEQQNELADFLSLRDKNK